MADAPPFQATYFCRQCKSAFLTTYPLDKTGVCMACRLNATEFDAAYCYGGYEGNLPRLIHIFKYNRVESLAEPLGRLLLRGFPVDEQIDAIVPVPLHWWKRMRRGFNQSQLLARELSRGTGLPVWQALRRHSAGKAQVGLTPGERRENVKGRFRVTSQAQVAGRSLLVVDDVLTTGATMNACARVLKEAGAARVAVLTLARADRRPQHTSVDAVMGMGASG
jgi:ComF family protein